MSETAGKNLPDFAGWQEMDTAPKDGTRFLAFVDDEVRFCAWGKTSHVPIYGWCLADQGAEDFDIVYPDRWMPLPAKPELRSEEIIRNQRDQWV